MWASSVARYVRFFSNAAGLAKQRSLIERRLEESFRSGSTSDGPSVRELETAIASRTQAKHAIGVASGTNALQVLFDAIGFQTGDEVVTTVYSFIASASTIVHGGGRPVFVDIDPVTYNIAVDQIEAAITPCTTAILPVHLFLQMADMRPIAAIAAKHGLMLLEDSAEGIDMRDDGIHAGLFGRGGVLSFFPTKTLGAAGDAGMVITNDDDVASAARHLQPFAPMDELQAAVLLAQLPLLDSRIARRRALADRYTSQLVDLVPRVETPRLLDGARVRDAVYYVYLIEADVRDELIAFLIARGIETEVYYPVPLHRQPAFAYLGYRDEAFPVASAASRRALALPLYPELADEDVDYVCNAIQQFYKTV